MFLRPRERKASLTGGPKPSCFTPVFKSCSLADATIELSLDSAVNNQKQAPAPVFSSVPSLERAANSSVKHQSKCCAEEEEEVCIWLVVCLFAHCMF